MWDAVTATHRLAEELKARTVQCRRTLPAQLTQWLQVRKCVMTRALKAPLAMKRFERLRPCGTSRRDS